MTERRREPPDRARRGTPYGPRSPPGASRVTNATYHPPVLALTSGAHGRVHRELGPLDKAAGTGDWSTLSAALDATTDPSDRTFLINRIADTPQCQNWLPRVADDDPVAAVVLAQREVVLAWDARSGRRIEHVGAEAYAEFHRLLVSAERRLTGVIAEHPDLGDAWVVRLTTARGLGLGTSEARRRFARVQVLAPGDFWAHASMIQFLCPKWYGSWEEVLDFARDAATGAPAGSPLRALPAYVQVERWLELEGGEAGRAYLRINDVAWETVEAATEGPLHPDYAPRYGWIEIENTFAMLFSLAHAYRHAAVHFRRIGDHVTDHPWHFLDKGAREGFTIHRDLTRKALM